MRWCNEYDDHAPDVSSSGSRIAFIGARPNIDQHFTSSPVLMVMNSDGSGQQTLVTPSAANIQYDNAPRWSLDGAKIVHEEQLATTIESRLATLTGAAMSS